MRQDHSAADLLISILRINAEADVELDGLIELLRSRLLDEFHCFSGRVKLASLYELGSFLIFLTSFSHLCCSPLLWL